MSQGVLVPVKKADVPEALLAYVAQDKRAGKLTSTWSEVVGWGSCKLVARAHGNGVRLAHSHYGYYDCCKIAEVESLGYATEGTSYRELPMWALTVWIMAKSKAKDSIGEGYRVAQTRIRLDRWVRKAMNQFTIYFTEMETGTQWRVSLYRGDTKPHIRFALVNEGVNEYMEDAA